MTLGEIIALFRQQADDATSRPLWDDTELAVWANEAEIEACRRARLLIDSRTPELCQIQLVPGEAFYPLDPRIIYLRRVKLASRTIPLEHCDYRDMDWNAPGWESHTGQVMSYVRGLDTSQLRIYKIPTVADTVNLLIVREPLEPMVDPSDTPEINPRWHKNLADWMLYRGYSRKEAQTSDMELALKHLAMFEGEFGTRNKGSALEEEWERNYMPYHQQDGDF